MHVVVAQRDEGIEGDCKGGITVQCNRSTGHGDRFLPRFLGVHYLGRWYARRPADWAIPPRNNTPLMRLAIALPLSQEILAPRGKLQKRGIFHPVSCIQRNPPLGVRDSSVRKKRKS